MLTQALRISATSLRGLGSRWGASLIVIVSLAGVVGVMVALLALADSYTRAFADSGRQDRVIVLRAGANFEADSYFKREEVSELLSVSGLAKDVDGEPLASTEKYLSFALPKKAGGAEVNVTARGVGGKVFKVRPELRLVQGRWFQPGKRELAVGRAAQKEFAGLDIGSQIQLDDMSWTVVGVFEAEGGLLEAGLLCDLETMVGDYSKHGTYSSITAVLESTESFATYRDGIAGKPSLSAAVKRESEYYAAQSEQLAGLMKMLGYGIAALMALGAVVSASNATYAAVRSRTREIATLRAIGFGPLPIVVSVLFEVLALCIAGAALAELISWGLLNDYTLSTFDNRTGDQVAFKLYVTQSLLAQATLWACGIGLLGSLFPALRAARLPIAEALRRTG